VKDPLEDSSVDVTRRGATAALLLALVGLAVLFVAQPSTRYSLAIVAGLVTMVVLHEVGHFAVAKRAGMKVTEFFVGFGPRLWSFRRGETEYGVKAVLLGGYVRVIGMTNLEEVDPADEARTFRRASYRDRLTLTVAGVTVNVLLALVLFFVVIAGQGRLPVGPNTTVSTVVAHSAAAGSGFRVGDRIVAVDGVATRGWDPLRRAIQARGGVATTFTVDRNHQTVRLQATPARQAGQGFLGVGPGERYRAVGLLEAVPESFRSVGDLTVGTAKALGRLVSPAGVARYSKNFTAHTPTNPGSASNDRPVSIIGIVDQGSRLVNGNVWALLWLLGGVSLILALFNLLPVLPFDGGHAAVVVYEWIASRVQRREVHVDFRKLMPVTAVVLVALLTLSLSAAFLDVRQAFGG
jgi:membrane-associated protease RseP (regulator of RpoE activity)